MRLTIERMRTLVLVAGGLLVTALVVFLAVGRWKNPFNRHDLPQKLGFDIQSDSGGITYTRARGGHTLFKIHASKVEQLKKGNALLHDVKIELYSKDGSQVDRIEGAEFEYDKSAGTARAAGTVEITLMRPGEAPAIAPKAATGQVVGDKRKGAPVAIAAETAARGEIHVKTSGLTLTESADQKSGVVTTSQRVDFSMVQGAGSSTGASYDSDEGLLVLDHAVELTTQRGTETIVIHAQHGEFERASQICRLRMATANYGVAGDFKASTATAGEAKILFREDGSAARLDATNGFTLATATGSHLSAPTGQMDFNAQNQPSHGHLEGGVTMDSASETAGRRRRLHGTAPTAVLEFTRRGQLQRTHLETGVLMESEEQSSQAGQPLHVSRHWRSSVADVEFRESDHARIEPKSVHGMGGVLMTSESQLGKGTVAPSRLSADELTGEFGADSVLTAMTGVGHASIEETTATGARQTTSGDRLEAKFAELTEVGTKHGQGNEEQLQSAMVQGHVVLTQTPAGKPGGATPSTLRATSGRADYQGQGEWLHLSLNPRVEDGALQLTADKVDVSRASGDAFAHGNVKASWSDLNGGQPGRAAGSVALGGQGPAHVVAAEAQLHQATGEVTFRGQARLWQQANSVAAPVIVLDRTRQTLTAQTANAAEPVKAVLVSAGGTGKGAGQTGEPSVVRVRGGDLRYSDVERKALMRGGVLGTVTAETGTATSTSDMVEVLLLPAGKPGGQATPGQAQVDHLTARGHVVLSSEGRRGTGEQLVYTGATGEYVLTGTASTPPRMTDSARGSVTGEVLIFQSRDRSVTVESGSGRKSMTETMAPR